MRARLVFFVIIVMTGAHAFARDVQSAMRDAEAQVAEARLPHGLAEQLSIQLNRASRLMAIASPDALERAAGAIHNANELLYGASARTMPPETRKHLVQRLEELSRALKTAPTAVTVPVTIHALVAAEDGTTTAAGAGVSVRVDGVEAATTGADGTASLTVAEGDHVFTAAASVDTGGSVNATLVANTTPSLDITMSPGGDFSYPALLDIVEATDGAVLPGLTSFTVHLHDDAGGAIAAAEIQRIDLESSSGIDGVTAQFAVAQNGNLAVNNAATFRALLLDRFGPFTIVVRAIDAQGRTWRSSARFDIGRYHVSGTVTGPASVPVSGIPFRVTNQKNGFSFWTTTTATGAVVYPNVLPEGLYIAHAEVVSGGIRYFVRNSFVLNADNTTFTATLKTLADQ